MQNADKFLELIRSNYSNNFLSVELAKDGHVELRAKPEDLTAVFSLLKDNSDFAFNVCVNVTAVDYLDTEFMPREPATRYEVVYHFLSIPSLKRLRLKVSVPENNAKVASATPYWSGADFMESEVWDMFGIEFEGHPGLRRVLMYPEFKGHPLRKDYPLQGKQPRVKLRHPEVHNTARDMHRPELVKINKKTSTGTCSSGCSNNC